MDYKIGAKIKYGLLPECKLANTSLDVPDFECFIVRATHNFLIINLQENDINNLLRSLITTDLQGIPFKGVGKTKGGSR